MDVNSFNEGQHVEAKSKWLAFGKQHFKIDFLRRKSFAFDSNQRPCVTDTLLNMIIQNIEVYSIQSINLI